MKQKLLKSLRLRATFLVALFCTLYTQGVWGQENTVEQTSFTATSGNVNNDQSVSYACFKGGGTSNPAVNGGAIRLYQNSGGSTGGYVVIGVADGYEITSATISSTMKTTTGYMLSNTAPASTPAKSDFDVSDYSLSANADYTVSGISTQYITFACFGTTSSTRLYLSKISVTYQPVSSGLTASDLALTGTPVALNFDLYNNSSAQTVSYTTSSTGNVTVSGGDDYVTTSVNTGTKTITVTPMDVTPSAQTITVSQEADATYAAGSVTFTVNITDSTPVPTHTATFSVNGTTSTQDFAEGASITFPSDPADISGKSFVGWLKNNTITGTTNTAPSLVDKPNETMGNADVTYYAVFADVEGSATPAELVINTSTENFPTAYGTGFNEYTLSGKIFEIRQGYVNGTKLQWRANGNSNGTGTIYNSDALSNIQSVVLLYDSSDTNKNFTLQVGDSENPTSGTSITPTVSNSDLTYTFDCSGGNYDYFVLTNGSGAGYLTSITINYLEGSQTVSNYCTTVVATTVATPVITVGANPFTFSTTATITCATDGATIKYSYDNSTWSDYASALTITETTTIYAKAIKGGDESSVAEVTVTKELVNAEFSFPQASYNVVTGNTFSAPTLSTATGYDGTPGYSSSNTSVATVNASTGAVTIVGLGTTTITASAVATSDFAAGEASYTLNVVNKLSPELSVSPSTLTVTEGAADGSVTVTTASGYAGAVTAVSDDTSVANVSFSAGTITITYGDVGTATITVTAAAEGDYESQTQTIAVTVNSTPLWEEDFSSYAKDAVPEGGSYSYVSTDGGTTTKIYEENLAGGTSPEILISKSGGSFAATIPLNGYYGTLTLTYNTNRSNLGVSASVGTVGDASGSNPYTIEITDVPEGTGSITITFDNSASSNARLDNIILTGTTKSEGAVNVPTFSPIAGAVVAGTTVTISSATGTTIKYTTDGTAPSLSNGTAYSTPVAVTSPVTIKAIAIDASNNVSSVAEAAYTITVTAPTFSPVAGAVTEGTTVSITAEDATLIMYTTDGTDPDFDTTNGDEYVSPITINAPTTLKAIAYDSYGNPSEVVTADYTVISTTINLTKTLVFLPETSGLSSQSYASNDAVTMLSGTFNGDASLTTFDGFTFKDVYAHTESGVHIFQMKASSGSMTFPTVVSTCGFDVNLDYHTNTATVSIGGEETTGTSATSTNLQIEAGSSYCRIKSITLTPRNAVLFSQAGGTYHAAQSVSISARQGYTVYYTTDGSDPTSNGTVFTQNIVVPFVSGSTNTVTIKAATKDASNNWSPVYSETFVIEDNGLTGTEITITKYGVTTFYADKNYKIPTGSNLVGKIVKVTNGDWAAETKWSEGQAIPKNTGVYFEGTANTAYWLDEVADGDESIITVSAGESDLYGVLERATVTAPAAGDYKFYKLTTKDGADIGWYYGASGGAAFTLSAGKAYLAVAQSTGGAAREAYPMDEALDADITAVTIAGYATLYSDLPLIVPAGVDAAAVYVENGQLYFDYCYTTGDVIPAETAVVLRADEGTYFFTLTDEDGTAPQRNNLRGSSVRQLTQGDGLFYKMALETEGDALSVGFYFGAPDGAAFINEAGKAYLVVPFAETLNTVRGYNFAEAETTGIGNSALPTQQLQGRAYDLQGRPARANGKGFFIVDGKKVIR